MAVDDSNYETLNCAAPPPIPDQISEMKSLEEEDKIEEADEETMPSQVQSITNGSLYSKNE